VIDRWYVNMDQWYSPKFERGSLGTLPDFSASSDTYFTVEDADALAAGLGGLGATYEQISTLQNQIHVRLSEVNTADAATWDKIADTLKGKQIPGTGGWFYGHSWVRSELQKAATKLVVTTAYKPSDADVVHGGVVVRDVGNMLTYYKESVAKAGFPAEAAKIDAETKAAEARMASIPTLQDPATVGLQTLQREINERAKALASAAAIPVGIIAAGALGVFMLSQRPRSNPGGIANMLLPLGVGAALFFLTSKSAPTATPKDAEIADKVIGLRKQATLIEAQAKALAANPVTKHVADQMIVQAKIMRDSADKLLSEFPGAAKFVTLTSATYA
jgi:hypothetical protein